MHTIAENTTTVTQKLFIEGMTAADGYRKYVLKWMGILLALWVVLASFIVAQGMGFGMALMELGILAAVGVWLIFFLPRGKYKRAYASMERRYGGNMTRTVLFYKKECRMIAGETEVTLSYEEIAAVKETRHTLVLTSPDKTGILISLDGFTKGDAESVQAQIRKIQLNQ